MIMTPAMMKVMLSLVRFIASNKTARLMVTLYSVLLHGLVFVVLYKMAMTESCKHDMAAKWHEKYIEHMQVRRKLNIYIYVVEVQEVNTLNSLHTSFLLNVSNLFYSIPSI